MTYQSVPFFSAQEWQVMERVQAETLRIAFFLLPVLLSIRFCTIYTHLMLDSSTRNRALLDALCKAVSLLLLLLGYPEILSALDTLTHGLMQSLDTESLLSTCLEATYQDLKQGDQGFSCFNIIPSLLNFVRRIASGLGQLLCRGLLNYLRGYLLIFSTQVGPLAIVASILPGKLGHTAAHWLSMHLAFLFWGVTMRLVDLSLATLNHGLVSMQTSARDLLASLALLAMYGLIGPLTSLYIGSMMGNSLFSATTMMLGNGLKQLRKIGSQ